MENQAVFIRKVGLNRGKPRIWLEGKVLADNGFGQGSLWSAEKVGECLKLEASWEGNRKVAGTIDRPIIDINSKVLLEGFTPGKQIEVVVIAYGHLSIIQKED